MVSWLIALVSVVSGYFYQAHEVNHPLRCPENTTKWKDLHEAVIQSASLIPQRRFIEARLTVSDAITTAMSDLPEAFNCSIGISSSFRILALTYAADNELEREDSWAFRRANQIALRLLHVAMNWLTHAFVVKGENDGRWIDESSWPLSIQEMNDEQTAIQHQITKGGPYGHAPTWADCPYNFRDKKLKIAIVTMCDYPAGHVLPKYSMSNKALYSEVHGYYVIAEHKRDDPSRPHAWAKISLLLKHVKRREYDWLLWFDCDSYFMNFDVTLDHVLYSFGSMVDPTNPPTYILDPDFHFLIQEDHAMLNTGVFFIRTSQWAENLLTKVYGDKESPWIDHPWWENAAFSHELLGSNHRKFKYEQFREVDRDKFDNKKSRSATGRSASGRGSATGEQPDWRSSPEGDMLNIYGPHVRVAPQIVFNSYHPITSRIFQHDTWEAGKFVLAFSGVTSGSSPNVAQLIYGNYYREMCEINHVVEKCLQVEELDIHPWTEGKEPIIPKSNKH